MNRLLLSIVLCCMLSGCPQPGHKDRYNPVADLMNPFNPISPISVW